MQITPDEIDTVEEAGYLHDHPVKLIKLKGGFCIALGRLKGKNREEALAAGSHPAIVKYNVEKSHPEFQPSMAKSEGLTDNYIVDKHSHFLSDELRKSGHDIYSVQSGDSVNFHVTKHNMKVSTVNADLVGDTLVINQMNLDKDFARALAGATTEKALSCRASKVKVRS